MFYLLAFFLSVASPLLAKPGERVQVTNGDDGRKTCTVLPVGGEENDVPNIREAFEVCGKDGSIVFPEGHQYWIAEKLHVTLDSSNVEWRGEWKVSFQAERMHIDTVGANNRPGFSSRRIWTTGGITLTSSSSKIIALHS